MKAKKKVVSLAVVLILLAIAATGTLAYITDSGTAHNVITTGLIDIDLIEYTKDGEGKLVEWPTNGVGGVVPGMSIDKIVSVKNLDNSGDAWVRVWVDWSIKSAAGAEMPKYFEENDFPVLTFSGLNTEDWTPGADGYWYYNEPVKPGESTEVLFESVNFDPKMGNEYQNCTAEVVVVAEAVQVKNNPIPESGSVVDIPGWPAAVTP